MKKLLILLVIIVLTGCNLIENKLEKLGYSEEEIKYIEKLNEKEKNYFNKNYNLKMLNLIKNENYDNTKFDSYLKYIDKTTYEKALKIVNNNIKEDSMEYSLILEKYYKEDNHDRYIAYSKNNNYSSKEIVSRVNCNLDNKYYTNTKPTDLSKGMYSLVNKYNYLEKSYVPDNLVSIYDGSKTTSGKTLVDVAYIAFSKMAAAAKEEGLTIYITTAFRDYNFQSILYNNYVKEDGVAIADTYSARPGFSEHQLGYAADLTNGDEVKFRQFKDTPEYEWLKDNAHKFGLILRYPEGKEHLTGYQFESWHYRYVGLDIAKYIYENDITYDEYYEFYLK